MKTLNLDINYSSIDLGETDEADVLPILFLQAVESCHPQGMAYKEQLMFHKLMNKFSSMNGEKAVELEDAEWEFAKDAIANGKFSARQNEVMHLVYQKFELID